MIAENRSEYAKHRTEIRDKLQADAGVKIRSTRDVSEMPMEGFDSDWDAHLRRRQELFGRPKFRRAALVQNYFAGLCATAGHAIAEGREKTWKEVYECGDVWWLMVYGESARAR